MKKICFLIVTLLAINNFAQHNEKVIATVGKEKITLEEFKNRFLLTPQVTKDGRYSDEIARRDFLYSIIAEKLWSLEAEKSGLDTSDLMHNTFAGIEKMFIRDALFKKEIESKIKITDIEIIRAVQREKTLLKVNFLFSSDSVEIYQLYKQLKDGVPFDSLLLSRDEYLFQIEPITVEYGKLNQSIEDVVYSLQKGNFSNPIKDSEGWFIYYVKDRGEKTFGQKENESATSKVKSLIQSRKREEIFQQFYKKFFGGKKVETDGELFWRLVDKIASIMAEKKQIPGAKMITESPDLVRLEKEFGKDTLYMPFIKFEKNPLSFKEFLSYFFFDSFTVDTLDYNIIARMLNYRVKNMIELEMYSREGISRGLQNSPEVKNDIEMWRENYLSSLLRKQFIDSIKVSDSEIFDYYSQIKNDSLNQTEVNILEILTDSLEVVEKILNSDLTDDNFRSLALIHTKREWIKSKGGEFGLLPVAALGEIGRIAMQMSVGSVYGPLKLPEGYSVFKVIEKKEQQLFTQNFEESKERLRKELSAKKYKEKIIRQTVELANKYGVTIDENLLYNTYIENLKMYVIRYMGFGGKMTAVPLTMPFSDWAAPWQESRKALP